MDTIQLLQIALEIWGAVATFACGLSTIISRRIRSHHNNYLAHLLVMDTLYLISDAVAIAFRGTITTAGFYVVRFSNFLDFAAVPLMILFLSMYILTEPLQKQVPISRRWIGCVHILCTLHLILITLSQFTNLIYYFDQQNFYHRADGYVIIMVIGLMELIILVLTVLTHPRSINRVDRIILICYLILPIASSVIQALFYGLSLNNIVATLALLFLFLSNEVKISDYLFRNEQKLMESQLALKDKEIALAQKNKELTEARLQLSVSQLQPHFIFNALGSIEQLCRIDSQRASEAIHFFSRYLRNNLHAINIMNLHSFSEELMHINSYIWLEKMRFGDDLIYTEDIQATDFQLPMLSVQPLVEYVVYQGLMANAEEALHITVASAETDTSYQITISDDSKAFIQDIYADKVFVQTIFSNIEERIQMMCKGSVHMELLPSQGKVFTVMIPKNPLADKEEKDIAHESNAMK